MKPEAQWEVEQGLGLSAYDISDASAVRTSWYHAVRKFFETYDYFIWPAPQFPTNHIESIGVFEGPPILHPVGE
jgi:hypothetical protein